MTLRQSPRRVLLIAPQPFYEDRGTPIAVRHVVTALSQLGWAVDIVTYAVGEDINLPRVRIFRFGAWLGFKKVPIGLSLKKLILDAILPIALLRRLIRDDYDCIHAVEEAVYPALLIGCMAKLPVIYDMQSSIPEHLRMYTWFRVLRLDRLAMWFERLACRKSSVVACSAGLAENVLGRYEGISASEWIFPDRYEARITKDPKTIRNELDIPETRKLVVYAGNFERYQGVSLLLSAVPLVLEIFSDAAFVLVGGSETDVRKIGATYPDLIERGQLVVISRQPRQTVHELLSVADVAVSPRVEGSNLPLKIFDYLAAGLPVVASDIAAHRSFGGDGLKLVEPRPTDLAGGILSFLKNASSARSYRGRAREITDRELAWSTFCAQVRTTCESACAVRGTVSARPLESGVDP